MQRSKFCARVAKAPSCSGWSSSDGALFIVGSVAESHRPKFAHSASSASVIALCLFCQLKGFVREFLARLVDEIVLLPTRGQILAAHDGRQLAQARQIQTHDGVDEGIVLFNRDVLALIPDYLVSDQLCLLPVMLGRRCAGGDWS